MSQSKKPPLDEREQESRRILERVERESESIGKSSAASAAKGFQKTLSGLDGTEEDNDPIEVLGKRIGRTLGWIAVAVLIVYLLYTYVL